MIVRFDPKVSYGLAQFGLGPHNLSEGEIEVSCPESDYGGVPPVSRVGGVGPAATRYVNYNLEFLYGAPNLILGKNVRQTLPPCVELELLQALTASIWER